MLVFDVGYRYLARLDQPSENRIELDVTPQIPLLEDSRHAIAAESTFDLLQATAPPGDIEIALSMQRTFSVRRFVFFPIRKGISSTAVVQEAGTRPHSQYWVHPPCGERVRNDGLDLFLILHLPFVSEFLVFVKLLGRNLICQAIP